MRSVLVVGIGTGNPEHMTMQAINALNRADIVLLPTKGAAKEDLADLRREICRLYLTNPRTRIVEFALPVRDAAEPSYPRRVADWHEQIAEIYRQLVLAETGADARIALLVWGDPSLYDSTLRILDRLKAIAGFEFTLEVVPGITSIQALAASHAVTLAGVGKPLQITTGRELRAGRTGDTDSLVVLLDGEASFRTLTGNAYDIYWGAYLGSPDEIVIAGRLADVGERIVEARDAARARKGWIMDVYLLRRREPGDGTSNA